MYCVPRTSNKSSLNIQNNYLPPAQKEAITNSVEPYKALGLSLSFADPVYMAVDLGVSTSGEVISSDMRSSTNIQLVKSANVIINSDSIRESAYNIILDYFNNNNVTLGQEIDVNEIHSRLLSIAGVDSVRTYRTDADIYVAGVSLIVWNPIYSQQDINIYNQNIQLPYYKFPYFYDEQTLLSRISVVTD
jgi:hypothetical protein